MAMGGNIAIMTVFAGFLYQHTHAWGVFWVMALRRSRRWLRSEVAA